MSLVLIAITNSLYDQRSCQKAWFRAVVRSWILNSIFASHLDLMPYRFIGFLVPIGQRKP
jgi:hypothetical protein